MNIGLGGAGGFGGHGHGHNPYGDCHGYRTQNWGSYHQQAQTSLEPQFIEQYAPVLFQQFDHDKSGHLDMNEVPAMIAQLFQYLNKPAPTQMDVMFAMYKHDNDGNGKISLLEFKKMLYFMSGRPSPM